MAWGLLLSYFCIKCGNNMWVPSCHLVGRKHTAFAYEVMFGIANLGYFLTPQYSQWAEEVFLPFLANGIVGRGVWGVPSILRLGVLPAGKGWRKGERLFGAEEVHWGYLSPVFGKEKKKARTHRSWLSELLRGGSWRCLQWERSPRRALAQGDSLAFLCWESRSRLCLKKKQKCTWAVLRNVR